MTQIADDADTFRWYVVGIPLGLMACFLMTVPCFVCGDIRDDDKWFDRSIPVCASFLFLVFLMFLVLRMDGYIEWKWYFIFIPLFTIKLLLMVVPCFLTLAKCCCWSWTNRNSRWTDDSTAFCTAAGVLAIFLYAPLCVFEVLLAQKLEHTINISWVLIFVPVFVIEGVILCGCGIITIVFICER